MKILLVTAFIPPIAGGSSFVIDNFSKNFNNSELVIVGERKLFAKSDKLLNGISVYRIFTKISIFGRGIRFFQVFRWIFFPLFLFRLYLICKKESCNYVIGVHPDNYYSFAALIISKINKINFSSYYHNTYVENRDGINKIVARIIQKAIFNNSDNIFTISDGLTDYYSSNYRGLSFYTLPHTFYDYPEINRKSFIEKSKWELVIFGNINASNADATSRFIEAINEDERFEIHIYTHVPKILLEQRGINTEKIIYHGYVDDIDFYEKLSSHDICILTHGFTGNYSNIEYKTIFPTRIIPMLLLQKPILAFVPEDTFIENFLSKNNAAVVITSKYNPSEIIRGLESIITNREKFEDLIENSSQTVELFYGPNVVNKFRHQLEIRNRP